MASSKVYFSDLRASPRESLPSKLVRLVDTAGLKQIVKPRNLVALKIHFGEKGVTAFIRPLFVRRIAEYIKSLEASPFLTDTNTLYAGTRGNSVSHIDTAVENGFAYSVTGVPIIIADGMRGASSSKVQINGEVIKTAHVGKEIMDSDALISLAHFKGHELSGFGGAIKNIGMGCASRKGKLNQHSDLSPRVKVKKCEGCGDCVEHCIHEAISLNEEERAVIDPEKCVGCGECILICPNQAINIQWNTDVPLFLKKMAEYTFAVLKNKQGRFFFVNFLTNISPACDCHGHSDTSIVADIGILASRDPVAIDQASVDLVNREPAISASCLQSGKAPGDDKFKALYPKVDWPLQLEYAERIGLGSRRYELVAI